MKCVFQSEAAENWTTGLGEYYTVKYSKYLVHNYVDDYTYIVTTHISNTSVVHLHVPSYIPYIPNTENLRLRAMFVFWKTCRYVGYFALGASQHGPQETANFLDMWPAASCRTEWAKFFTNLRWATTVSPWVVARRGGQCTCHILSLLIFGCWRETWGFCSRKGGYVETHSLKRFVTAASPQRRCKQNHRLFSLKTNVAEVVSDLWAWRWWLSGTPCRISHNSESEKGVFQRQDSAQRKHEGVLLRTQILRDWFLVRG